MHWLIAVYITLALAGVGMIIAALRAPDLSEWATPTGVAGMLLTTVFGGAALGAYLVSLL